MGSSPELRKPCVPPGRLTMISPRPDLVLLVARKLDEFAEIPTRDFFA